MRRLLVLAAVLVTGLAAAPARAATITETLKVPTKYGRVWAEIVRPDTSAKVPIILTYSPYNTLSESPGGTVADDSLAQEFVPQGYARVVADVLGTRNSTGCWDYGGAREQQSGVDLVNALAKLPWSNGKVGMIGASYDGTTANMVAVRGADVPGLAAIAPQAAINHWYGYAYQDGVRFFGNSRVPTDEGIDTPLGFDFGLARTPPTRPDAIDQGSVTDLATGRYNPCDSVEHTQHGYDTTPDYDTFWKQRDYRKDAANVRVPVLVTHGWQDYNVKQSEGLDFYMALTHVPFKILYMWQGPHGIPSTKDYDTLLTRFFARTLKGVRNGVDREPPVHTVGRTGTTADAAPRIEKAWPPAGTRSVTLELGRGPSGGVLAPRAGGDTATLADHGTNTEERALQEGVTSEDGWLFYETAPLKSAVRMAGSAYLDPTITDDSDHGQLSPTLVDVAPDGSAVPISRGHLNLQYRNGLEVAEHMPTGTPLSVRVRLSPQDQTVPAGHRIGVIVSGSNVVWAVPDLPGFTLGVLSGASKLVLPVVGGRLPGV